MLRTRFLTWFCIVLTAILVNQSATGNSIRPATIAPELPGIVSHAPAPGMLLVARRALDDSHFGRSVVYLVAHGDDGTMGLIVNRPSEVNLFEALPDVEDAHATGFRLHYGGPVGVQVILMLVRDDRPTAGMAHVTDDVYISSDRQVLDRILASDKSPNQARFYLGHSGWRSGQLDLELERGSWHVVPADTEAIFSGDAELMWQRLIDRLEPQGLQV